MLRPCASITCPDGWTGSPGGGPKCMKLSAVRATHEGCTQACGAGASLACIQTASDDALAATVSAAGAAYTQFLWLGEYQWPLEEPMGVRGYLDATAPMHGQQGWGKPLRFKGLDLVMGPCQPAGLKS